jgi:hypothetical protein
MVKLIVVCLFWISSSGRSQATDSEFHLNQVIENFVSNKIQSREAFEEALKAIPTKGLPRFQKLRFHSFREEVSAHKNFLDLSAAQLETELNKIVAQIEPGAGTKNMKSFASLTWLSTVARRNSLLGKKSEGTIFLFIAGTSLHFREFSGEEFLNSILADNSLPPEKKIKSKKMIKENLEHHHPEGIPQTLLKEFSSKE